MTYSLFLDFDGVLHARDAHAAVKALQESSVAEILAAGQLTHCQHLPELLTTLRRVVQTRRLGWA